LSMLIGQTSFNLNIKAKIMQLARGLALNNYYTIIIVVWSQCLVLFVWCYHLYVWEIT